METACNVGTIYSWLVLCSMIQVREKRNGSHKQLKYFGKTCKQLTFEHAPPLQAQRALSWNVRSAVEVILPSIPSLCSYP